MTDDVATQLERMEARLTAAEAELDQLQAVQANRAARADRQRNSRLTKLAAEADPDVVLALPIGERRQVLQRMGDRAVAFVLALPDPRSWMPDLPGDLADKIEVATAELDDVIEVARVPRDLIADVSLTYITARRLNRLGFDTEYAYGGERLAIDPSRTYRWHPEQWAALVALDERFGALPARKLDRAELEGIALQTIHYSRASGVQRERFPLRGAVASEQAETDDEIPAASDDIAPRAKRRAKR